MVKKLRAVGDEIKSSIPGAACAAVAKHLEQQAANAVPEAVLPQLLEGLAEGVRLLQALPAGTYETLLREVTAEFQATHGNWARVADALSAIDPAFIQACSDAVCNGNAGGGA